jgi:hypothetical protein
MVYRPGLLIYATVFGMLSGTLLATGKYLGGAITGVIAFLLVTGRYITDRRGEDDRFTLW